MHIVKKFIGLSVVSALLLTSFAQATELSIPDPEGASVVKTLPPVAETLPMVPQESVRAPSDGVSAPAAPDTQSSDPEHPVANGTTAELKTPVQTAVVAGGTRVSTTTDGIFLDDVSVKPESYNINGYNYFKLRDIAWLMMDKKACFSVGWDNPTQSVTVTTGATYEKDGKEMQFNSDIKTTKMSQANVLIDGKRIKMEAYNISGNNYFKLRDISEAIGFEIGYVEETRTITIDSGTPKLALYTVNFDSNGQNIAIASETEIAPGSKITSPIMRAVDGYGLVGWYKERECITAWDFAVDTVTENLTLFAKWGLSYTATFEMNGHGTQVPAQGGLIAGKMIAMPAVPVASGFVFDGWYADSSCSVPWVFQGDVIGSNNVILFAKWIEETQTNATPQPIPPVVGGNVTAIDGVMTVLVDAGHGGTDSGCAGSGYDEKHINISVALRLQKLLESAGVKVIMTRTDAETTLRGQDRIAFVEQKMREHPLDLSISIHHNAANYSAAGAEVYVQSAAQDPTGRSKALGGWIMQEYKNLGQRSRGVKDDGTLYMVRVPSTGGVPGILSEFCFLDNPNDLAKIDEEAEQQAEAQALYNAIIIYFQNYSY